MFCLGAGGAGQIYKLTIKLEGGAFRLRGDGPARAGRARPGPAQPGLGGTFNKGPQGPETLPNRSLYTNFSKLHYLIVTLFFPLISMNSLKTIPYRYLTVTLSLP